MITDRTHASETAADEDNKEERKFGVARRHRAELAVVCSTRPDFTARSFVQLLSKSSHAPFGGRLLVFRLPPVSSSHLDAPPPPRTLTPRPLVAGTLVATTTLTMLSHILISTLVLSIAAAPTSLGDAKEAVSECPAPCLEFVPHNLSTTRPRCTIPTAVRSDGGGSHRRRPLHRRPRLRHLRHRLLRLRHLRLR